MCTIQRHSIQRPFQSVQNLCPVQKATVCLHDYHKSGVELVCVDTEADGNYTIPAPIGVDVIVSVKKGTHTNFARHKAANPDIEEGAFRDQYFAPTVRVAVTDQDGKMEDLTGVQDEVFIIKESALKVSKWKNMDYHDHTSRVVRLDAHGTLCKFPLGSEAIFKIQVPGSPCTGSSEVEVAVATPKHTDGFVLLPAHSFDFTLLSTDPVYPSATDKGQSCHAYTHTHTRTRTHTRVRARTHARTLARTHTRVLLHPGDTEPI